LGNWFYLQCRINYTHFTCDSNPSDIIQTYSRENNYNKTINIYYYEETIKVLLGFLGGVAAGALLGVLYAPDKGSKTRTKSSKRETNMLMMRNIKQRCLFRNLSREVRNFESRRKRTYRLRVNRKENNFLEYIISHLGCAYSAYFKTI
jgi:hypothetical protein